MKLSNRFLFVFSFIFLFFIVLTPSISALGEEIDVDADNLVIEGFDIYAEYQPPEKLKKSDISWKKINGTKTFYPKFKDNNLYNGQGKLKVPLTEFHFVVDKTRANEFCTSTQYYRSCSWDEPNFSVFIAKNNITSTNITEVYISNFDAFWEVFFSTNWMSWNEFQEFVKTPVGYRYSFYGIIDDLDPEINQVFDASSQGFFNLTEASTNGISLIFNGTASTGYNNSNGDFKPLGVFFNQSSTHWNLTFSIADSNGSAEVFDKCVGNISCISYYPLDTSQGFDVNADAKNGNDGTPTGTDNTTGLSSGSINFDGVSDKIAISGLTSDASLTNAISGAISIWAHIDIDDGNANLPISFSRVASATRTELFIDFRMSASNDRFRALLRVDGTDQWIIDGVQDGVDAFVGEWVNVVLAHNSTEPTLYINGELMPTTQTTTTDLTAWFKAILTDASSPADTVNLGLLEINAGEFTQFDGGIDEVMIFNTTLTDLQIRNLYKAGLSQHANTNITALSRTANTYNVSDVNLTALYGLNNNTLIGENGTFFVNSNNNRFNASCVPATCPTLTEDGVVGNAYEFDGINDQIETRFAFPITGSGERSISVWARKRTTPGSGVMVEWGTDDGSGGGAGERFDFAIRETGVLILAVNSGNRQWTPAINPSDEQWHHYVVVLTGGTSTTNLIAYQDGVLLAVAATGAQTIDTSSDTLLIGIAHDGDEDFNGTIDDIRIYNRSLSASEVLDLYELDAIHINWFGGEDNFTNHGIVIDGDSSLQTTNATFMQYKTLFQSNDTAVSPYQLNHTIRAGVPSSVAPPVIDSITINFTDPTPANGTTLFVPNILVNVSVTNTSEIDQINISLFNSTQDIINSSFSSGSDTPLFVNFSGLSDGDYFFNATTNLTEGTFNFTETRRVTVNAIFPDINFTNPTPSNGSEFVVNNILVNVSSNDLQLDTLTIFLFNSTKDQINITSGTTSPLFINFSGLVDGTYFINATANDTSNQVNLTETRTLTIDSTAPVISQEFTINITGDINGTVVKADNLTINVTVIDALVGVDAVWVVIWEGIVGGTQILLQFMTNVVGDIYSTDIETNSTFPLGEVNYSIFANDTLNNEANVTANFTIIDGISPTINFTNPTASNNANFSKNDIVINVTATDDTGISLITMFLFNSTDLINSTETSATSPFLVNFTNLIEGVYTYNVSVNDTSNNFNVTELRTITLDRTAPSINFTNPTPANNTFLSQNSIETNVTSIDGLVGLDTIVTRVYNITGDLVRNVSSSTSPSFFTFTGLINGTYFINASANDTVGNINFTETRMITLLLPGTTLIIFSPQNATFASTDVDLNVSATDINGIDTFWYSLDGAPNITFVPNITFATVGFNVFHNITVYVNNTFGVETSEERRFFVGDEIEVDIYTALTWLYLFSILLAMSLFIMGFSGESYILKMSSGILFMVLGVGISIDNIASLGSSLIKTALTTILIGIGFWIVIDSGLEQHEEGSST